MGEWFGMEKASWVEDIAWSRRCKWDMDMVLGLENMPTIERNIEPIVYNAPKSVKSRSARRGFVLGRKRAGRFVSVSHRDELAFLGLLQRGRRCEFRVWSGRRAQPLRAPWLGGEISAITFIMGLRL